VADHLGAEGHTVVVPDLREAARSGDPHVFVRDAAAACGPRIEAVVAHSGAGTFLPGIATAMPQQAALVFVDAGVPPCAGDVTAAGDFRERLHELAVDGELPAWSTWWGDGVMETLVPDELRRRAIVAELQNVPLALYDRSLTMPDGWCSAPAAYLLLSDEYREDANTARSRRWPVIERRGGHLDIATDPATVADDIMRLIATVTAADRP
jgi:hypothetical protein